MMLLADLRIDINLADKVLIKGRSCKIAKRVVIHLVNNLSRLFVTQFYSCSKNIKNSSEDLHTMQWHSKGCLPAPSAVVLCIEWWDIYLKWLNVLGYHNCDLHDSDVAVLRFSRASNSLLVPAFIRLEACLIIATLYKPLFCSATR